MFPYPMAGIQTLPQFGGLKEPKRRMVGGSVYRGRPATEHACHSQGTVSAAAGCRQGGDRKAKGAGVLATGVPAHVTQLYKKKTGTQAGFCLVFKISQIFKRTWSPEEGDLV